MYQEIQESFARRHFVLWLILMLYAVCFGLDCMLWSVRL